MKSPYVSELQPNQVVTATFLVQQKDIRQKKTGEPYLSMILCDRTGELEAKMWDNAAEVMETFERDDFLKVRGLLQVYQNRLQLTVHKLQRQPDNSVDFTDYYPCSTRDPEQMFAELLEVVRGMQDPHLRALLMAVLEDGEVAKRYKIAPAAKNVHHAFLGGLLEHVLSMCSLARLLSRHYTGIDLDLVLAGAVLHDIGKIYELTYDRSFGYSNEGQLLGHIVIGLRLIDDKVRAINEFPQKLRLLLEHLIVSHHGALEFGSPKVPAFPEALLLHHIDNLDSKMECMRAWLEKDRYVEGCWTGYNGALDRSVLKKRKFLEEVAELTQDTRNQKLPLQDAPAPADERQAQTPPKSSPAPTPAGRPAQVSIFAEKLQGALKRE
jgi:3'-5' exoribonuclease